MIWMIYQRERMIHLCSLVNKKLLLLTQMKKKMNMIIIIIIVFNLKSPKDKNYLQIYLKRLINLLEIICVILKLQKINNYKFKNSQ